ncbi:hypothetical protein VTL71DRAFT_16204 [Oculimacula yallundae]|uniref:Uncharacterized protein n=1 Tax=Oculimacula yallundae TaxID=86028 RepID=A0ABR4CF46_9HELO
MAVPVRNRSHGAADHASGWAKLKSDYFYNHTVFQPSDVLCTSLILVFRIFDPQIPIIHHAFPRNPTTPSPANGPPNPRTSQHRTTPCEVVEAVDFAAGYVLDLLALSVLIAVVRFKNQLRTFLSDCGAGLVYWNGIYTLDEWLECREMGFNGS